MTCHNRGYSAGKRKHQSFDLMSCSRAAGRKGKLPISKGQDGKRAAKKPAAKTLKEKRKAGNEKNLEKATRVLP